MEDLFAAVQPFLGAAAQAAADAMNHPNPAEGLQPVQPPQAPVQELAEVPFPAPQDGYDPIEPRIGGESLSRIYLSLICKYKGELPPSNTLFDQAYSIFEIKRKILLKMEELDQNGNWLATGAQFIKTKKGGDYSLKSLNAIFESLERVGHRSEYFDSFVSKRDRP